MPAFAAHFLTPNIIAKKVGKWKMVILQIFASEFVQCAQSILDIR